MINGIKPSQIDMRNNNLKSHYNKLSKIINTKPNHFSTFDKNIKNVIMRKKYNHQRWKNFKIHQSQSRIYRENSQTKDKLMKIIHEKPKMTVASQSSRNFNKSNYFYERKRLQTEIDHNNPEIAKRILKANGPMNHKKDIEQFRKTRQFVKRLERFPMIKRMNNSIDSHRRRFKTQERKQKLKSPGSAKSISSSLYFKEVQ